MDSEANFQRFNILNLCNVSKKAKNDRFCCSSAVLSKVKLQNVFRKFHCCSSPCSNSFLGRENSIPIGNYMFKVNRFQATGLFLYLLKTSKNIEKE